MKAMLVLICLFLLTGCGAGLKDGKVSRKDHTPAHMEYRTQSVLALNGEMVMAQVPVWVPDRYELGITKRVKNEDGTYKILRDTWSVSEAFFKGVANGDNVTRPNGANR